MTAAPRCFYVSLWQATYYLLLPASAGAALSLAIMLDRIAGKVMPWSFVLIGLVASAAALWWLWLWFNIFGRRAVPVLRLDEHSLRIQDGLWQWRQMTLPWSQIVCINIVTDKYYQHIVIATRKKTVRIPTWHIRGSNPLVMTTLWCYWRQYCPAPEAVLLEKAYFRARRAEVWWWLGMLLCSLLLTWWLN